MDWTRYTTDPCDKATQIRIHEYLASIRVISDTDDVSWILREARGKSVIDIGCVEHDLSYTDRPSWKHRKIVDVASRVVGVDILEEFAMELNRRGYDIRVCDATSDEYLGEQFDVAVLGDVIEHVENPVNLIRFAMRHLKDGGKAIVKTPNPYYIDNVIKFAKGKDFVNFEHIAWYTPTMALELARRTGCELTAYVVFPRKRPWCRIFSNSDIFTRDFLYVFTRSDSQSDNSRVG